MPWSSNTLAYFFCRNFRLVRVAGPLMVDSNLSVKHAAVGSLKNLSLVSGEVCEEMVLQVQNKLRLKLNSMVPLFFS